jgi:hypothetical protein
MSTQIGAAYVLLNLTTGWTNVQQTATLTSSDGRGGDSQSVVAISGDTIWYRHRT